ncbi:Ribosomal protein S24/S35 [Abeliophyllum distichum]|uniref:Ribosomal protein S24/S35 n=1 Tax=Abeliophyllum distichum TaxID=126358 RepID=A0ABD1RFV1_9LAMI
MKPSLAKKLPVYARKIFPIFTSKHSKPVVLFSPLLLSSKGILNSLKYRFFTSDNGFPTYASYESNSSKDDPTNAHDVSNKELKEQIDRFFKGDDEAIPSIFEAILKRKLEGTAGDESDNEFMKELQNQPKHDDVSDKEFDSD